MAQALNFAALTDRLSAAAKRIAASPAGLCAEVTATDLVIAAHGSDGGHGQGRTESIPFGIVFHDEVDRLGQAIDRIERYCAENPSILAHAG